MTTLSILLPSFSYPKGVSRILEALTPLPDGVELLISDDSPDMFVEQAVKAFRNPGISYWHNTPAKGAARNWNGLLDKAQGKFVLLLHHDEVPIGEQFLERLLPLLETAQNDVFMMDVILLNADLSPIRRHVPWCLRERILHDAPSYLFRRNVIGPTGALVVRRSKYPRFNTKLRWLIDVDLYYRMRRATSAWVCLPDLAVGSVQGEHQTITASIQGELAEINNAERRMLRTQFPEAAIWLEMRRFTILRGLETVVWSTFRIGQSVLACLTRKKIK